MTTARSDLHPGTDAAEATLTASRALLGVVARSIAGALHDVSLPQFRILVILTSAAPLRTGNSRRADGALPSTFTRALDRMVDGGWAERVPSPHSRREVLMRITANGRALAGRRLRPIGSVVGRALVVSWPAKHWGWLGNYPDAVAPAAR